MRIGVIESEPRRETIIVVIQRNHTRAANGRGARQIVSAIARVHAIAEKKRWRGAAPRVPMIMANEDGARAQRLYEAF